MSGYQGNNPRGGGGRSGRSGGRGRGGRNNNSRGSGGRGGGGDHVGASGAPAFRLCNNWTTQGTCPRGNSCSFAHVVKLHGVVDASTFKQTPQNNSNNRHNNYQNNQQQRMAAVTSVSIWETAGVIKIFTGSQDGYWRLWNTGGGQFVKEFENNMNGDVECVAVVNNFLFCGFDAISRTLPEVSVGMVHAWNLQQTTQPPLELHIAPLLPYAHNQTVTALVIAGEGANAKVVSGSRDGSIRVWAFQDNKFVLFKTLAGHAREVTGLVILPAADLLWSCATDGSIRIWNLSMGECQYCITRDTPASPQANPQGNVPGQAGVGHTHAVTGLLSFDSPAGSFILSSSLDRSIKAWNGSTGECVASELHDEGVVCMSLAKDPQGSQILLVGLESGSIMGRNLVQTAKVAAFAHLFTLNSRFTVAHSGAVKDIASGPAATFYSVGADGKMMVFQFTGDLGLQ